MSPWLTVDPYMALQGSRLFMGLFLFVFTYQSSQCTWPSLFLYALRKFLLYLFYFLYASLLHHLDPAGTGGLPSDVSPDEVHSSVLKSAKALHVNAHDR